MTPQGYFVPKLCHKSSMGYVFTEDFWLSELQVSGHMTSMDSLIRTVKNTKLITAILSLSKPATYLQICTYCQLVALNIAYIIPYIISIPVNTC